MKFGRSINGPKLSAKTKFLCSVGIHTYYSQTAKYDERSQFEGYYDVCLCGRGRKRDGTRPLIYRTTNGCSAQWGSPRVPKKSEHRV